MALEFKDMLTLTKLVANAKPSAPVAYSYGDKQFSYSDLADTVRSEFAALAPDYRTYKVNQNTIFALLEQTIDDVLPKRVLEQYSQFAEIKTFSQGDKPIFTQKITQASKRRAKQFIGKVGLAGLYEVFKLDGQSYEVTTDAIGGAAQIGFEEFLDGRVDFADVLDIVMQGLDECIYVEIEKQLIGAVENVQGANKVSKNTFSEVDMDKLISIADAYGQATIYCTFEFAATMIPSDARMSDAMKENLWLENGYFATYKGHKVVVLPNSFEDEKNTTKVIDPAYAWIIPTGAQKPVKIAFEGQTIVQNITNRDQSMEIQMYKKFGVGTIVTNNICVYKNASLTR